MKGEIRERQLGDGAARTDDLRTRRRLKEQGRTTHGMRIMTGVEKSVRDVMKRLEGVVITTNSLKILDSQSLG